MVFSDNGTVSFRSTDAAGNVTAITEYTVTNIDKIAPDVPTGLDSAVDGHVVTVTWIPVTDAGSSGVKGCFFRYGEGETPEGEGIFVSADRVVLTVRDCATYSYQLRAADNAGNLSDWSELQSFIIVPVVPQDLQGSSTGVSWQSVAGTVFEVEYSTDGFSAGLSLTVDGSAVDTYGMPAGTYQWRVRDAAGTEWVTGDNITAESPVSPGLWQSDTDGDSDLFFARSDGAWSDDFAAQHLGRLGEWSGTGEQVELKGKNRLTDVFVGSEDANVLVLTDDTNGDALFLDDIFSDSPFPVQQARLSQIGEIRAGAGNDVVDLTSQQFLYIGAGVTVRGGDGDDVIWANSGSNILFGDAGSDRIVGASGNDVIIGGAGNDTMHGGGGEDTFTFGGNWGVDTVEQLAGGMVTLWFETGDENHWDKDAMTYTDGLNSVTVKGISADAVLLQFGGDVSGLPEGAFADATSEKIFEDRNKGVLA